MTIEKSKVQIGSDFEMFLEDNNGKIISAIQFNEGTKQLPEKLEKEGCCIQRDGVLQECNVPPVYLNQGELFWENVAYVKNFLTKKFKSSGLKLKCCASATLDDDQMQDEEALILGCDPDFNAWEGGTMNDKPHNENKNFRTSGGHFHLSYPNADVESSIELVKLFDLFVTVPFILIDTDKQRRKLYGKAGAFRLQQWGDVYGVEFRQLSNKCFEDRELVLFVFHQLDTMLDHFNNHGIGSINHEKGAIVECINTSNEALAKELCEKYNINLPIEFIEDGNMLEPV